MNAAPAQHSLNYMALLADSAETDSYTLILQVGDWCIPFTKKTWVLGAVGARVIWVMG